MSAEFIAAMENPNAFFKVFLRETIDSTDETVAYDIFQYELSATEIEVTYLFTYDHGESYPYICLRRGTLINGVETYIDTGNFTITESVNDGDLLQLETGGYYKKTKGTLFPRKSIIIAGDDTYRNVITAYCAELGRTAVFKNYAFHYWDTNANDFWDYQFLPAGKQVVTNSGNAFLSMLKQKYMIYACDNGNTNEVLFFTVYSGQITTEITITRKARVSVTYNNDAYISFFFRDEAGTIHQYPGGVYDIAAKYNLGFLPSTAKLPTNTRNAFDGTQFINIKYPNIIPVTIAPPDLQLQQGDTFLLVGENNIQFQGYADHIEYLNTKKAPVWGMILKSNPRFTNTEGGALPSTIERVAAYTPLVSTGFDGNLTPAVNNLQALAQAVDDMEIGGGGLESVTGDGVDNTDPLNPVLTFPTPAEIGAEPAKGANDNYVTDTQLVVIGNTSGINTGDQTVINPPATTAANDFQVGSGAGAWIKKTLAETITILRTSLNSIFAPIAKGVTNGDSHDHNGGDGGQIAYSGLSGKPTAETNAADIFACANAGTSEFAGTIASKPGGAVLTYNVVSGNENALVPANTNQLAKLRLYNTTRGTHALISNCVTATNTITLTGNVPDAWQNGDAITIASPTVSGASASWVDIEITSGITNKSFIFAEVLFKDTTTVGKYFYQHPTETYAVSKLINTQCYVANTYTTNMKLIKLVNNLLSIAWSASGAATASAYIREAGYLE